jgi:transposase
MIQLACFLRFHGDSALAKWCRARTKPAQGTRKTMIVALARKPPGGIGAIVRCEGLISIAWTTLPFAPEP